MDRGPNKNYRLLVFKALKRSRNGLTRAEIISKIDIARDNGRLGIILREEQEAGRIETERHDVNGRNILTYSLTEKGRQALAAGNLKRIIQGPRR